MDPFRLHLYNTSLLKQKQHSSSVGTGQQAGDYVDKFGFECDTCCGFIPMPNKWQNNWVVSSKASVLCT